MGWWTSLEVGVGSTDSQDTRFPWTLLAESRPGGRSSTVPLSSHPGRHISSSGVEVGS